MSALTRRGFLRTSGLGLGVLAGGGLAGCAASMKGDFMPKAGPRVVVIGGGWGGATAAKYVRLLDPGVEVVLIEPNRQFVSCPFSNLVLAGLRSIDSLTMGYDGLRKHGVRIIHETASAIEPDTKRVRLGEGYLQYDRLVVSPGVDFQWEQVEGLAQSQDTVLHAWKAGPQTVQLAQQLAAMPDGGVFVLSIPLAAYRCPPGPYERTSMVAWYLKANKPRSKLIVLDANQNIISKAALFREAWQAYPNIDYRPASRVIGVDPGPREVRTEFDRIRYDVVNIIPPQRAGAIADRLRTAPAARDETEQLPPWERPLALFGPARASRVPHSLHSIPPAPLRWTAACPPAPTAAARSPDAGAAARSFADRGTDRASAADTASGLPR